MSLPWNKAVEQTPYKPPKKCPHCAHHDIRCDEVEVNRGQPSQHIEYYYCCYNCNAKGGTGIDKPHALFMWNLRRKKMPKDEFPQ